MSDKIGCTTTFVVILLMIIPVIAIFNISNKYIFGNKQYMDFKQTFRYAIMEIDGKTVKLKIKAWKDWKQSDTIQFITEDDQTYYTHLNRVILTDK